MLRVFWLFAVIITLAACQAAPNESDTGPLLVREVTVAPTDLRPTRFLSPTPIQATQARPTGEVVSPLSEITVDGSFVIVTPTLPPSKTPTVTPTQTQTPTITPTTTMTNTATQTAFFLPTSEIIPFTQPASSNANRICDSNWTFIQPPPAACPLNAPTASNGVYQQFQNGTMIWVGTTNAIYVLYNDSNSPRWEVHRDNYNDSNPNLAYLDAPPHETSPGLWSARRGFGLLWELNSSVQNRIGYAIEQWEQPFSVQVQTASDGTLFISTPRGFALGLFQNKDWSQYGGSTALPSSSSTSGGVIVPLPPNP